MSNRNTSKLQQRSSAPPARGRGLAGEPRTVRPLVGLCGALVFITLFCGIPGYLLHGRSRAVAAGQSVSGSGPWRCLPEHQRGLKRVVLSLAKRDTTLALQDALMCALPDYTKIILLLPEGNVQAIRADLADKPYAGRVQLVSYEAVSLRNSSVWLLFRDKDKLVKIDVRDSDTASHHGSSWAQDMFKVARDSAGGTILLSSWVHKWFSTAGSESADHIAPDNAYLDRLSMVGVKVRTLPLAFMGGNIAVDQVDGRPVAFVGGDILRNTRTVYKALRGISPSDEEITAALQLALNVDKTVILGKARLQPGQMYHLDQAMILLPGKVAAVARIVGKRPQIAQQAEEIEEARQFLAELRQTLGSLGYRMVDVDTSVQNVLNCQHYVNAIPYVDAETGQRTLLMPVFNSAQSDFDKSLIAKNTATFGLLGYKVVPVPTSADRLRGGIHCLVNVLE